MHILDNLRVDDKIGVKKAATYEIDVSGSGSLEADGGKLRLRTVGNNHGARYSIRWENNNTSVLESDDSANQTFSFFSTFSTTRTFDARLRVYGKAADLTDYIQITHDGTNGIISTDTGNIELAPSGLVRLSNSTTNTDWLHFGGSNLKVRNLGGSPDTGALLFGDGTGWKFHIGRADNNGSTKFVTFKDTGQVGLGTTDPIVKLELSNTTRGANIPVAAAVLVNGATAGNRIMCADGDDVIYMSMVGSSGFAEIATYDYAPGGTIPPLVLNSNGGNVGIFTTPNANAKLHVHQTGAFNQQLMLTNAGTYHTGFLASSGTPLTDTSAWGMFGGPNNYLTGTANHVAVIMGSAVPAFHVRFTDSHLNSATGSNQFTVLNGGNVGIGGSPTTKLELFGSVGNLQVTSDGAHLQFTRTSANYIKASGSGGYFNFNVNGAADGSPTMQLAANGQIYLGLAGNVGINNSSPQALLDVSGGTGTGTIYISGGSSGGSNVGQLSYYRPATGELARIESLRSGSNDQAYLAFWTKTTGQAIAERLRIDYNGNVGIGVSASPSATLEIRGTDGNDSGAISLTTSSTQRLQLLPFAEDNVAITFDSYYGTGNWRSGDLGSNFRIYKFADVLQFNYASAVAVGSPITWNTGFYLGTNGALTINGNVSVGGLLTFNGGGGVQGTGTQNVATTGYVQSRGMNLVTNGFASLGNNYNFTGYTYDNTDFYVGKASFRNNVVSSNSYITDEYYAVDPDKYYVLSFWSKSVQFLSHNRAYAGINCRDMDGNVIAPLNHMRVGDTRLSQPLTQNDMVVNVDSVTNWRTHTFTATSYERGIIIWGYKSASGYKYPDYTYSRYYFFEAYFGSQQVTQLILTNAGSGYTNGGPYTLGISGGDGSGATGQYWVVGGAVVGLKLTAAGQSYTSAPTIAFNDAASGTPSVAATATALVTNNATASTVQYVTRGSSGSGYTGNTVAVTFSGGSASVQATGHAFIMSGGIDHIVLTSQGSGYRHPPTVTIGGAGTGGTAYATLGTGIDATNKKIYLKRPFANTPGNVEGFVNPDNGGVWPIGQAVSNTGAGGTYKYCTQFDTHVPATWTYFEGKIGGIDTTGTNQTNKFAPGTAFIQPVFLPNYNSGGTSGGGVISTTITNFGAGVTSIPTITFSASPAGGLGTATGAVLMRVFALTIATAGTGYAVNDVLTVNGGTGRAMKLRVNSVDGSGAILTYTIIDTGQYSALPTFTGATFAVSPTGGTGFTANLTFVVESILVTNTGFAYVSAPTITFGSGSAVATATIGGNNTLMSGIYLSEVLDRNVRVMQPNVNDTTQNTLTLRAGVGSTARILEWQSSSPSTLGYIATNGDITMSSGSLTLSAGSISLSNGTVSIVSTATTGQPNFWQATNSTGDVLQLKYTEQAISNIAADLWQFRIGGAAARNIAFTNVDALYLLYLDTVNARLGIATTGAPSYPLHVNGNTFIQERLGIGGSAPVSTYNLISPGGVNTGIKSGQAIIGNSGTDYGGLADNVRFGSSNGTYTYDRNDYASYAQLNAGSLLFLTAASGTAGNSITFTQRLAVHRDGAVTINSATQSSIPLFVGGANSTQSLAAKFTANNGIGNITCGSYSTFGEQYSSGAPMMAQNLYAYVGSGATSSEVRYSQTHGSVGYAMYRQSFGAHQWYGATGATTVDQIVTPTLRMQLSDLGYLGVGGVPDASYRLKVYGNTISSNYSTYDNEGSGTILPYVGLNWYVFNNSLLTDALQWFPPNLYETYNGSSWNSSAVPNSIRSIFTGAYAFGTHTIANNGQAFRVTWNNTFPYNYLECLSIYSSTSGNDLLVTAETSANGSAWTTQFSFTINSWPGVNLWKKYVSTNGLPYVRLTFTPTNWLNGNNIDIYSVRWMRTYPVTNALEPFYVDADRNVIPRTSSNLGISSARWNTLYSQTINVSSTTLVTNLNANYLGGFPSTDVIVDGAGDGSGYNIGDWNIASNSVASSAYSTASLELREYNFGGAQTGNWTYAPRLAFHFGGRVASQVTINPSDGYIEIIDNPGTAYTGLRALVLASSVATGTSPLQITSTTLVSNLTAHYLGAVNQDAAYFSNIPARLGYTPVNQATVSGDWNSKTNGAASFISGATNGPNGVVVHSGIYMPHASAAYGVELAGRLSNLYLRTEENGVWASWNKLWHEGNDGAASGLDSDLLDGQHGSFYQNGANLTAGSVTLAKIESIANNTILGNNSGSSASPSALTASAVKTLLAIATGDITNLSSWPGSSSITTVGSITTSGGVALTGGSNSGTFRAPSSTGATSADPTTITGFNGFRSQFATGYGVSMETWYSTTPQAGFIIWNAGTAVRWIDRTYNGTVTNITGSVSIVSGLTTGANISTTGVNTSGSIGLSLENSTSNLIHFNTNGVAAPTMTTARSVGTKIVFWPAFSNGSSVDYAVGVENSTLWHSVPTTSQTMKWYGGTTVMMSLTGSVLDVATNITVGGTSVVLQTRTVSAGSGLTGGGDLSANRTISIASNGVTQGMMANLSTTSRLLGSSSASAAVTEITLGSGLSLSGTTLSATGAGITDGDKGDITVSSSGTVWTIDNGVVTFAKIGDINTDRLFGRDAAGTGSATEISVGGGLEFTGSNGIQRSALTGDVTASAGSNSTTIANLAVTTGKIADDAVTYAKIQNISVTDRILGRDTTGAGDIEELTVSGGLEFTGSGGIQRSALTGDVTASAGSNSTTIANNAVTTAKINNDAVTYAKIQNVSAASKLLGRGSAGGAGDPEEITLGTGLSMSGTTLNATGGGSSTGVVPVGGVVAWLQNLGLGAPAYGSEWLPCDATTIPSGTFAGYTTPDLNGSGGTASQYFLRGSSTSGSRAGSETHTHTINYSTSGVCAGSSFSAVNATAQALTASSTSTLPVYYTVVWIMRYV